MSRAKELLLLLDSAPLSGPPGKKKKIVKDGLTKKEAMKLAKEMKFKGTFASVFPSDKVKGKRMVITWV